MKQKICLDIRVGQKASKFTGVGIYANHLACKLLELDVGLDFYFLVLKGYDLPFDIPLEKLIIVNRPKRPESTQELFDFFDVKKKLIERGVSVFHSLVPGVITPSENLLVVTTIHDVIQDIIPQEHDGSAYAKWLYRFKMSKAIKATKIITNSAITRNDLLRYYNLVNVDVTITYLGPQFSGSDTLISNKKSARPYLLYLGGFNFRKNIAQLIYAYADIATIFKDIDLVIAGKPSAGLDIKLRAICKEKNIEKRVLWLGFVQDKDLPALYTNSTIFIYPSLYEGFGLPVLEAMQMGTPVITSNKGSIPEIVGDAALMVNVESADDITHAITRLLNDESLQKRLSATGIKQAAKFSWEKCAYETAIVYKNMLQVKK